MKFLEKIIEYKNRKLEIEREVKLTELSKICNHEWEILKEIHVMKKHYSNPFDYEYVLVCKKCGEIKFVTRNETR